MSNQFHRKNKLKTNYAHICLEPEKVFCLYERPLNLEMLIDCMGNHYIPSKMIINVLKLYIKILNNEKPKDKAFIPLMICSDKFSQYKMSEGCTCNTYDLAMKKIINDILIRTNILANNVFNLKNINNLKDSVDLILLMEFNYKNYLNNIINIGKLKWNIPLLDGKLEPDTTQIDVSNYAKIYLNRLEFIKNSLVIKNIDKMIEEIKHNTKALLENTYTIKIHEFPFSYSQMAFTKSKSIIFLNYLFKITTHLMNTIDYLEDETIQTDINNEWHFINSILTEFSQKGGNKSNKSNKRANKSKKSKNGGGGKWMQFGIGGLFYAIAAASSFNILCDIDWLIVATIILY